MSLQPPTPLLAESARSAAVCYFDNTLKGTLDGRARDISLLWGYCVIAVDGGVLEAAVAMSATLPSNKAQ